MPKLRTQDNCQRTNAGHEISVKGFNVFNGCFFGSQESNTCTTELRQGPSTPQFVIVQCVAAKVSMRSRKIIYRKQLEGKNGHAQPQALSGSPNRQGAHSYRKLERHRTWQVTLMIRVSQRGTFQ